MSRQHFIAALPEQVWSPFLNRVTRWSPLQVRIVTIYVNSHEPPTQRDVADRLGCSQGTVSKTLAMYRRLGLAVVRTTRGRLGRTLVRLRDGVRRLTGVMIPPQYQALREVLNNGVTAPESLRRGVPSRLWSEAES